MPSLCGLCTENYSEENIATECKSCLNISLYRDKKEKSDNETKEKNDSIEEQEFPGPCKIQTSPIFGNYVVASRRIEAGELICKESPLFVGPYGLSDLLPFCLSCYKDIGLSSKCSKCKWPVCNSSCENVPSHADNECKVLSENNVRFKGFVSEYFCIEVLRSLLGREKCPEKWAKLIQKEAHFEARHKDGKAVEAFVFIRDFIRDKCKLTEFDEDTINRATGVLSVNTFWTANDLTRYASILFDKVSLLPHDCDPNTQRNIYHHSEYEGQDWALGLQIQIHATRAIEEGEVVSTQYVVLTKTVKERRAELKDLFYFDCCCGRCLVELMAENNLNDGPNTN